MKRLSPTRLAAGLLLLSLPALSVPLLAAPATAMPAPVSPECFVPAKAAVKRLPDHAPVSKAQLRRVKAASDDISARRAATAEPITVTVRAHIIKGTHRSDKYVSKTAVRKQVAILNDAYSGGQSAGNEATPFVFTLASIDYKRYDAGYHAGPGSTADHRLRRAMHLGKKKTLNLYFVAPRPDRAGNVAFGWSSFPWEYSHYPRLDGVSINIKSMPGGSYTNYNLGDTGVHEAGHWLGLLHTFQGGCSATNDGVADTPAERYPAEGCPADSLDTCLSSPGTDPIHNFMDYANDPCMFEFTPGQNAAMQSAWATYRAS